MESLNLIVCKLIMLHFALITSLISCFVMIHKIYQIRYYIPWNFIVKTEVLIYTYSFLNTFYISNIFVQLSTINFILQIKIWFQNRRTKWKRKYSTDLEMLAQHYYQSMGLYAARPMVIGDRLWLFNYPSDTVRSHLVMSQPPGMQQVLENGQAGMVPSFEWIMCSYTDVFMNYFHRKLSDYQIKLCNDYPRRIIYVIVHEW